mmetsp:Transcript_48138/g.114411  ORF Transcript_48138/g.114411 Transcript_48138/m.114411 type:complete len:345 (-) Transcript_48138:577-1611(-)
MRWRWSHWLSPRWRILHRACSLKTLAWRSWSSGGCPFPWRWLLMMSIDRRFAGSFRRVAARQLRRHVGWLFANRFPAIHGSPRVGWITTCPCPSWNWLCGASIVRPSLVPSPRISILRHRRGSLDAASGGASIFCHTAGTARVARALSWSGLGRLAGSLLATIPDFACGRRSSPGRCRLRVLLSLPACHCRPRISRSWISVGPCARPLDWQDPGRCARCTFARFPAALVGMLRHRGGPLDSALYGGWLLRGRRQGLPCSSTWVSIGIIAFHLPTVHGRPRVAIQKFATSPCPAWSRLSWSLRLLATLIPHSGIRSIRHGCRSLDGAPCCSISGRLVPGPSIGIF